MPIEKDEMRDLVEAFINSEGAINFVMDFLQDIEELMADVMIKLKDKWQKQITKEIDERTIFGRKFLSYFYKHYKDYGGQYGV